VVKNLNLEKPVNIKFLQYALKSHSISLQLQFIQQPTNRHLHLLLLYLFSYRSHSLAHSPAQLEDETTLDAEINSIQRHQQ
jgi:hypothetical protein